MTTKKDALNWFELHVTDFDRAKRFYEAILKTSLQEVPVENRDPASKETCRLAVFPYDNRQGVGGAISHRPEATPGAGGTLVYLNVEGDLDGVINRIPTAGGLVVKPRTSIGEHGYIALFKDTEGNSVGLHSLK